MDQIQHHSMLIKSSSDNSDSETIVSPSQSAKKSQPRLCMMDTEPAASAQSSQPCKRSSAHGPLDTIDALQSKKIKITGHDTHSQQIVRYGNISAHKITTINIENIIKFQIYSNRDATKLDGIVRQNYLLFNRLFDDTIKGFDQLPDSHRLIDLFIDVFSYTVKELWKKNKKAILESKFDHTQCDTHYQSIKQLLDSFVDSECQYQLNGIQKIRTTCFMHQWFSILYPLKEVNTQTDTIDTFLIEKILLNQENADQLLALKKPKPPHSFIQIEIYKLVLWRLTSSFLPDRFAPKCLSSQSMQEAFISVQRIMRIILVSLTTIQDTKNMLHWSDYLNILFSMRIWCKNQDFIDQSYHQLDDIAPLMIVFFKKFSDHAHEIFSSCFHAHFNITTIIYLICDCLETLLIHPYLSHEDQENLKKICQNILTWIMNNRKKYNIKLIVPTSLLSRYQTHWGLTLFEIYLHDKSYQEDWISETQNIFQLNIKETIDKFKINIIQGLILFYKNSLPDQRLSLFALKDILQIFQFFHHDFDNPNVQMTCLMVLELEKWTHKYLLPLNIERLNKEISKIDRKIFHWLKDCIAKSNTPHHLQFKILNLKLSGFELGYPVEDLEFDRYIDILKNTNIIIHTLRKSPHDYFYGLHKLWQFALFKFHTNCNIQQIGDQRAQQQILKKQLIALCESVHQMHSMIPNDTKRMSQLEQRQHIIYLNMYQEIYFIFYFFKKKNILAERSQDIPELNQQDKALLNSISKKNADTFKQETNHTIASMPLIKGVTQYQAYCGKIEDMYVGPIDLILTNTQENPSKSQTPCTLYLAVQTHQYDALPSLDHSIQRAPITLQDLTKSVILQTALSLKKKQEPDHELILLEIPTITYQQFLRFQTIKSIQDFDTLKKALLDMTVDSKSIDAAYLEAGTPILIKPDS